MFGGDDTNKNKVVYFGDSKGDLYSYNPATEGQERITKNGSRINCIIPIDGLVYIGDMKGRLHSCNPVTKKRRKITKTRGPIHSAAALDGVLYFGSYKKLHSYNPASGQGETVETDNEMEYIMTNGRMLYFGDRNNGVNSYNPATKKQQRIMKTSNISCMAVYDGTLYFGSLLCLYEYNQFTREPVHRATTNMAFYCTSTLEGKLYLGDYNGNLCSYDAVFDTQKRLAKAKDAIFCMTKLGKTLYLGSADKKLYSYNIRTEKLEEVAEARDRIHSVAVG